MPKIGECSPYDLNCRNKTCTHVNLEPPFPGVKDAPRIMDIVTDYGVPMRVVFGIRLDMTGKPLREYGRTVQFYDKRYRGTEYGQFIGDWSPSIFLEIPSNGHFPMNGTNREWMLDHASRRLVSLWLDHLINAK